MDSRKNTALSELARTLRKNMTRHERHLWYDFLKGLPGKRSDAVRDTFLRDQGLTVLRYANSDVDSNFPGVCADILAHLQKN